MAKNQEMHDFKVVVLGVIFDPKTKKILIGKREQDPSVKKITWCFPGGRLNIDENPEEALKKRINEKTGLDIESLGCVLARTFPERKDMLLSYFLCEITGGKPKAKGNLTQLKWVSPDELEKHFTTSFHPHLKEYVMNLK